jgi:hypothetical protein
MAARRRKNAEEWTRFDEARSRSVFGTKYPPIPLKHVGEGRYVERKRSEFSPAQRAEWDRFDALVAQSGPEARARVDAFLARARAERADEKENPPRARKSRKRGGRDVYAVRWPGRRRGNPSNVITLAPRWHRLKVGGEWNKHVRGIGHTRSGVYALRDRSSGEVLYVGESHTGRLWKTLLHHFQGREKFSKVGEWTHGAPERLDVAVWLFPADEALAAEGDVIERLEPSGNLRVHRVTEEESGDVPF